MLNGFGTVVNALGKRVKPYLPQICGTILWRLNNKSAKVRQQAADLISRIAVVMKTCQEVSNFFVVYMHWGGGGWRNRERKRSGLPRHSENRKFECSILLKANFSSSLSFGITVDECIVWMSGFWNPIFHFIRV